MKSTFVVVAAMLVLAAAAAFSADDPQQPNPDKKADELFGQLDKNSDGTLTAEEVGEDQAKFFDRLVRRGDADENGQLNKEEFLKGLKDDGPPEKDGKGRSRGDRPAAPDPEQVFKRLDKNSDGKLTLDELEGPGRERMAAMFEKLGTEEVTKDEFVKFAAERRNRFAGADGEEGKGAEAGEPPKDGGPRRGRGMQGRGPRVPKLMEILDGDKDGKLTKEELAKAVEMFDKLDTNKVGSLDAPELMGPPPGGRGEGGTGDGPRRRGGREGGGLGRIGRPGGDGPPKGDEPPKGDPPKEQAPEK